jgi:hypothetical protein
MPRPSRAKAFSPRPRSSRKPIAWFTISRAAGGSCWPTSPTILPVPPVSPAFFSTSSASEPTSVKSTAVRTWGSVTSYPRSVAIEATIRVAPT